MDTIIGVYGFKTNRRFSFSDAGHVGVLLVHRHDVRLLDLELELGLLANRRNF